MELTTEEKKILNTYSKILQKFGIDKSFFSMSYSYGAFEYDSENFEIPISYNNFKHDIPVFDLLLELPQRIFDKLNLSDYINEESNWQTIYFTIYPSKKIIEITNEVAVSDTSYEEYIVTFENMTEEEINGFEEMKLACDCPLDSVEFSGGGDDGYVESRTDEGYDVDGRVEDLFLNMLNENQGGWEMNEGSQGTFFLNYKENNITLNFGLNYNADDIETIINIPFGS